jgi:hypothetical protein
LLLRPLPTWVFPAAWRTLYELTKVEPAVLKDGRVNPKMERKEVAALLPTNKRGEIISSGDSTNRAKCGSRHNKRS